MQVPQVHLNGSDGQVLAAGYSIALEACEEALDALRRTAPHQRDYYLRGDAAWACAVHEHQERVRAIAKVAKELETLQEAVEAQAQAEDAGLPNRAAP